LTTAGAKGRTFGYRVITAVNTVVTLTGGFRFFIGRLDFQLFDLLWSYHLGGSGPLGTGFPLMAVFALIGLEDFTAVLA
jgi:hypothetical protein